MLRLARAALWLLARGLLSLRYRIRVHGLENFTASGARRSSCPTTRASSTRRSC